MWQIGKDGNWHLLWSYDAKLNLLWKYDADLQGCVVPTACNSKIKVSPKKQEAFPGQNVCAVCNGVWHIVSTSVQDAQQSIRQETDLNTLNSSQMLTKSVTLRRMIAARIRKVEKEKEKERKLRLLQKAYD